MKSLIGSCKRSGRSAFLRSLHLLLLLLCSGTAFPASVNQFAPSFALQAIANYDGGRPLNIRDFRGKVVYLDFWASWCGPCRKSLPALNELRGEYDRSQFEVVAVNLDEELDDAMKFLADFPVEYPVVRDAKSEVPTLYALEGMPTAFIIDREGVVRHIHTGFNGRDIKEIQQIVNDLVKE